MDPFEIYRAGLSGLEQGKQRGLAGLLGKAYAAPEPERQSILAKMAVTSPQAAFDADKHFGSMQDDAKSRLGQSLAVFDALPDAVKPQAYGRVAQEANALGMPVPSEWNPEYAPHIKQMAQALGAKGGAQAMGVQSTYIDDKGQRVAIMRDGSVQVLGNNAPNNQIIDTGNGYFGVNKGNLSAAPVQVGGQQQAPQVPITPPPSMAGGEMFAGLGNIPGVQVTSGLRTPERNAKVGGVANSYHLTDQARDILPPKTPEQAAQVRQFAAQNGLEVIDEGDHWHMEPRGQQGQQLRKAPPAMTPFQQASLGLQQQKLQAAMQARDQATQAKQEAAAVKAQNAQRATSSRQAEASAAATQLVSAIDTLTKSEGFNDLGTTWGDVKLNTPLVRNDAKDADAQLKNVAGQVALTTMARLKALSTSGATGFGSLTAPELRLLENSIATLQADRISNTQLKTSLKVIKDSMAKVAQWQPQGQQQAPAQPTSGGRQVTRTGTQNGRKVVQYSDGSVEYAD